MSNEDEKEWVAATTQNCDSCNTELPDRTNRKLSIFLKGSKVSFELLTADNLLLCDDCLDDLNGASLEVKVSALRKE